jgi:hypothetical protein
MDRDAEGFHQRQLLPRQVRVVINKGDFLGNRDVLGKAAALMYANTAGVGADMAISLPADLTVVAGDVGFRGDPVRQRFLQRLSWFLS